MKACLISLGCPKNLTDAEVILGDLSLKGYSLTNDEKEADIIVVNTCAFLQSARDESIATIKGVIDNKKDGAKVFVSGCLPEFEKKKLKQLLPSLEIDGIINSTQIFDSHTPRVKATQKWSAYIKISEGCDNCCSYCLIPSIRGDLKNRDVDDIIREVEKTVAGGAKEIIFVAQDTAAHPQFVEILKRTAKIDDVKWLRVMYAHPKHVTDELIKTIAETDKICNYIDLPIQHTCDSILNRMGRGVDLPYLKNLVAKIRKEIAGVSIRTSIILGFPGERDKDFQDLLKVIEELKFERLGAFEYSKEDGTPASKLRGQVPDDVKKDRVSQLMLLQSKISKELNKKLIGNVFDILIENIGDGYASGRTYMDAPEVDCSVKIAGNNFKTGQFVKGKIVSASSYDLVATTVT